MDFCHLDDRREERSPADLREGGLDEGDLSVGFASFEMTGTRSPRAHALLPSALSPQNPMKFGSGWISIPKRSRTPLLILSTRVTISPADAPPVLISASVCLVEMPARPRR